MAGIAFFDLDRTLITVNSGRLWLKREIRHGRVGPILALRAFGQLGLYFFGVASPESILKEALGLCKGLDESTVQRWTQEWYAAEVAQHEARGARQVIQAHHKAGEACVLLTSSSPYASACAVRQFGLDDFLSTRYEIKDGLFTGEFVPPVCFGEGKVYWASRYCQEHGVDLKQCAFYTDSFTDLPALLAVGRPVAVQPDFRLRLEARRRGWPVADWTVA